MKRWPNGQRWWRKEEGIPGQRKTGGAQRQRALARGNAIMDGTREVQQGRRTDTLFSSGRHLSPSPGVRCTRTSPGWAAKLQRPAGQLWEHLRGCYRRVLMSLKSIVYILSLVTKEASNDARKEGVVGSWVYRLYPLSAVDGRPPSQAGTTHEFELLGIHQYWDTLR